MPSACCDDDAGDEHRAGYNRADQARSTTSESSAPTMRLSGRFTEPIRGFFVVSGRHDKNLMGDRPPVSNQSRSMELAKPDTRDASSLPAPVSRRENVSRLEHSLPDRQTHELGADDV